MDAALTHPTPPRDRPEPAALAAFALQLGSPSGLRARGLCLGPPPAPAALRALGAQLRGIAALLRAGGVDPTTGPGAHALVAAALLPPLPGSGALALRALSLWSPGEATPRAQAAAAPPRTEAPPWGRVDLVAEAPPAGTSLGWGLVRLVIDPGQQIPHHLHRVMAEWERPCGPGLWTWTGERPARPLPAARLRAARRGEPHGYANPTGQPLGLLCLNRPAFLPEDEVPATRQAPLLLPLLGAEQAPERP